MLRISAKTGEGVPELLDAVIERIPAPTGDTDAPLQALMFDSYYDTYRGVISSVRVFNGVLRSGAKLRYLNARQDHDAEEIGVRLPVPTPVAIARSGRGRLPHRRASRTSARPRSARPSPTPVAGAEPLAGYRDPKPMVFCGLYPVDGDEYADLREALERLRLNDSSFTYEPETSGALGFGFRCGFLGLLHMEIIRERLEREYDLSLVATAPNVEYRVQLADGRVEVVDNPSSMPPPERGRGDRGAVREGHDPHADRLRRHAHGARAAAAGRDDRRWSTSRSIASSSSTRCRSARSCSTSSTR